MDHYWLCAVLFRIFLPLVVAIAVFIRPTITSYIYLMVGCYMPFFSVPTKETLAHSTGNYMKILLITCICTTTLVMSFYFSIFFKDEDYYYLKACSTIEKALRTVGIVSMHGLELNEAIPWCISEPLMLVTSVALFLAFRKLCQETIVTRAVAEMDDSEIVKEINRKKILVLMLNTGKHVVVFLLCLTSVLKPSAFGGVYYFVFLSLLTYWACNQVLGRVFGRILVCLIPILFLNMTIVFWYQFQYFQDSKTIDSYSTFGRLFNLVDIKTYKDCDDPRIFKFHAQTNATYAVPICLFFLYYMTVLVSRETLLAGDGITSLIVAFFRPNKKLEVKAKFSRAFAKIQQKRKEDISGAGLTKADKVKMIIEEILQFIISISYLVANFVMMIWAIVYMGWNTLVLLIWANLIWLLPFRKKVMLASSPFIVLWVWFLLATSYLYSLDLTDGELPPNWKFIYFNSGVEQRDELIWVNLLTKSLFGVIIFITMRQFWQERALQKHKKVFAEAVGVSKDSESVQNLEGEPPKSKFLESFQSAALRFFAIWWIWVVIITMISMDFWSSNNIFRIVFVGLAFIFVMTFQLCPFKLWKKFIRFYWWIVIIYAMANLIVIYMYQMELTRGILLIYVSENTFQRYGFQILTDQKAITLFLSNPIFFQIAVVVQQNFLQDTFDRLTSPTPAEELRRQEKELAESGPKWRKTKTFLMNTKNVIFQILEVHMQNIVLLIGWYMCIHDVCALFVPFVLLFTASCIFRSFFRKVVIYFISFLVQILIVLKLVYMKKYWNHSKWNYVGYYTRNGKSYNVTLNFANWLGFHESRLGRDYADFWQLSLCFLYVFLVTVMRVVEIRMRNYRLPRNLDVTQHRVLFPKITYENCHQDIGTMLKFLTNYGFYKFGSEITMIFACILISLRMDAIALVICIWLLIVFALRRSLLRIIWLPSLIIMVIAVPAQYIATLGLWPSYWNNSLTKFWNSNDFLLRIQQFCHLMNMAHPPKKEKITFDFWLLLLMSRQWRVFMRERKLKGQYSPAGNSDNVSVLIDDLNVANPVPDFITYTRSYLDVFKRLLLQSWFYLALIFTFLAGTMKRTMYSFGYILAAFIFMWEGTDLFLRPPGTILTRWNLLIGYTLFAMIARLVSQIFGCILKYETSIPTYCKLYQILTIDCVDQFNMTGGVPNLSSVNECPVDYQSLSLVYDCVCFLFLIIQQRIFKSFHFIHIVNEKKAQTILEDRGALTIEEIRQKNRQAMEAEDAQIRDNIKKKMDRIRATHLRIQGDVYTRRKKNHRHILKSCDYYLFDEAGLATDIHLLPEKQEEHDNVFDPYDPMPITDYFGLLHSSNMATVLAERDLRRSQKKAVQEGKRPEDLKRVVSLKESKPGPSKDTVTAPPYKARKVPNILIFLWGAFESFIVSLTGFFNRRTVVFRSILDGMTRDRKTLKEKTKYAEGLRLGSHKVWHPVSSYKNVLDAAEKKIEQETMQYSIYVKLLRSVWYLLLNHSEWLCYLFVVLNQVIRANFISLPLVVMVFCWGSLTVPKPTKTFWIVCIAYILIMMFLKNFFLMDSIPWNAFNKKREDNLFFPPYIIFGTAHIMRTTFNLLILGVFFFNRFVLQMLGLWKPWNYRISSGVQDGDYILKDGKLVPIARDAAKTPQALTVKNTDITIGDYFPTSLIHGASKYAEGFKLFIQQLVSPVSAQIPVDVYTPMFFCDLINLILIMFFYGEFWSAEDGMGFIQFVRNNRVPFSYIVVVLFYFFLMVVDRGFYLRKNRFGKLVYHFCLVIGVHIWFFILYPLLTEKSPNEYTVIQLFYVSKCLYFMFSAYQIRNGYPPLISCHFLWHGTTIFNRFGYKFYRQIPYFFEMRTLLDWICSDSSLGVSDWFKMEEITQNIFDQKCEQEFEDHWCEPANKRKNRTKKYIFGGFLYFLLILTVIFPFLLFSLGNAVGVKTHPSKFKIQLYMGSAEPIYQSYASERNLVTLTEKAYKNLTSTFNNVPESESIFGNFKPEDVVVVTWSPHSLTKWKVSPGTFNDLMQDLLSNAHFSFRLEISYTHVGHGGTKQQRIFGQSTPIPPLPNTQRKNLIEMLEKNETLKMETWVPLIFPKFMLITKESMPVPLRIMGEPSAIKYDDYFVLPDEDEFDDDMELQADPRRLRNLLVNLRYDENGEMWWHLREDCSPEDDNYFYYLKDLVHNGCNFLVMYTFNEKVFSSTMNYLTQSGILGLYVLYFMLVIGIIRSCRIEIDEIWIEDLPNSNRMMRKCIEVYVARDMQNYELEEELFAELIFIMRSRELLIKLTREDDDDKHGPT